MRCIEINVLRFYVILSSLLLSSFVPLNYGLAILGTHPAIKHVYAVVDFALFVGLLLGKAEEYTSFQELAYPN